MSKERNFITFRQSDLLLMNFFDKFTIPLKRSVLGEVPMNLFLKEIKTSKKLSAVFLSRDSSEKIWQRTFIIFRLSSSYFSTKNELARKKKF